jgi:glycosyltransferase involved in cell wall biosynthesis
VKIFFLSDLWLPFPGGAERFTWNIANQLRIRGHEIEVLTSYFKFAEGWAGSYQPSESIHFDRDAMRIHFNPIGVRSQGVQAHVNGWLSIAAQLAESKPDVLITHHFFAREFADDLAACGVPVVHVVHNGARLPFARLAVFNSEHTRGGSPSTLDDLTILPPAFPDVVAPFRKGAAIGFIKPIAHKGVDFFYRLAEAMPERKFLVLRGEWRTLEDIRPRLNVEFMDPVIDVRDFYARCRVMLVPSLVEDAGTVPQEAALNMMPCISSGVQGLAETNRAGINLSVNELASWVGEIQRLDDEAYHAEVAKRQFAATLEYGWTGKFNLLDERIRRCAIGS